MWAAIVQTKYSVNWAYWFAAKNQVLAPVSGGSTWIATARPCLYYPEG